MLTAAQFREKARNSLSGNWGIAILAVLIYFLLYGAAGGTVVGGLIIYGPLTLGLSMMFLNIIRGQKVIIDSLFDSFGNFVKAFVLGLLQQVFILLWLLLFIIPGIVKAYSYSMSFYILADNPETKGSEAIKKSMEMMKGHKGRLFCLDLSFIGWFFLSFLTLGIGFLWLIPYIEAAHAHFYEDLKNR